MATTVIPASEIKPISTTLIVAKYNEMVKIRPTGFLRSMFKDNVTKVLFPSYDVRRGSEKVAPNVILGHQGLRTEITKSTQKILDLFYFRLYINATGLDAYWNLFGSEAPTTNLMIDYVDSIMGGIKSNQDMIERAYELMCAQILINGTCSNPSNPNNIIDFGRKADSMVDPGAGNYWATAGVDPYQQIAGLESFIRKEGKYSGGVFNAILSAKSYVDFINNDVVKGRNDLKMWKLDDLVTPEQAANGATYMGTISTGPYTTHMWQYPQFYEAADGTKTPYIADNYTVIVPPNPDFQIIYGATPQLVTPGSDTSSLIAAPYVLSDYILPLERQHQYHTESRGIPVPIAIDTIGTLQTGVIA